MISDIKNTEHSSIKEFNRIFELQRKSQYHLARTTANERIAKLKKLRKAVAETFNTEIKEAVFKDLAKHKTEVELNEIFPIVGAIKHAIKNLKNWMRDDRIPAPLNLFGYSHRIKYEPKGQVLIIAPWNFPVNLAFIPLVSAIASGNAVILKPSEVSAHSSAIIAKIVASIFEESEVAVILGGVKETTEILTKPFNHIFFTGSPQVGKIVMKAASNHLTSVCLELGGKSPTIVDETANVKKSARRIAWAKCMNNGQVCIAPDYLFVHSSILEEFKEEYKNGVEEMHGEDPAQSGSYGKIINDRHFSRLQAHLDDAIEKGGKIEMGGQLDANRQYMAPTMISNLGEDASLWQEEIFGPILPIRSYENIEDVIAYINKGHKPLALYIYSKSKKNIQLVIDETRSGAVGVNYSTTHIANPYLPFGGSNNSGIGKGNGFEAFKSFSNQKGIQKHWSPFDSLKLFYPPYTETKNKLVNLLSKWLA